MIVAAVHPTATPITTPSPAIRAKLSPIAPTSNTPVSTTAVASPAPSSPVASLTRLSPPRIAVLRRGTRSRSSTACTATVSVGETIAPSRKQAAHGRSGIAQCATSPTHQDRERHEPDRELQDRPQPAPEVDPRRVPSVGVEQRRQEDREDQLRLELERGSCGISDQTMPATASSTGAGIATFCARNDISPTTPSTRIKVGRISPTRGVSQLHARHPRAAGPRPSERVEQSLRRDEVRAREALAEAAERDRRDREAAVARERSL